MCKILIAGDFCPQDRITQLIENADYSFFDNIKEVVGQSDYSIVNLECPTLEIEGQPIAKCGPSLKTSLRAIDAIKYAGFDCATLANNHFRDYGDNGCISTINELRKNSIDYVGGGRNITEAQKALLKVINGKTLAIINICENEFSIATDTNAGSAPIDLIDNYNQITEARKIADYVLVIVHGGHEGYQLPSPRMKKLYRHFVSIGADAVVNHHQHCYSGYEYFKNKPIIYGLGNFCFDSPSDRDGIWNEGYCVEINFADKEHTIRLHPYIQCNTEPKVLMMSNKDTASFYEKINHLNGVICNDYLLKESFNGFIEQRKHFTLSIFASYHNRYLNAAANKGWIPHITRKSEIGAMLNYLACESHRDITTNVLLQHLNK